MWRREFFSSWTNSSGSACWLWKRKIEEKDLELEIDLEEEIRTSNDASLLEIAWNISWKCGQLHGAGRNCQRVGAPGKGTGGEGLHRKGEEIL